MVALAGDRAVAAGSAEAAAATHREFEVTVSLHAVLNGADQQSVARRADYAAALVEFAQATCEQTSGRQVIRDIRVFTGRRHQASADIIWAPHAQSSVHSGGFGISGQHVFFGEDSVRSATAGGARADPKKLGYALSQLWQSYTNGSAAPIVNALDQRDSATATSCVQTPQILWMSDGAQIQVVLDRSGSMRGAPSAHARHATRALIDAAAASDVSIGIASFAGSFWQHAEVQPAAVESAELYSGIANIVAGGSSRLYDGALQALDQLNGAPDFAARPSPQAVMLLSDGGDISSLSSESDVGAAYANARVALHSFGYGPTAPTGMLTGLSGKTGGQYTHLGRADARLRRAFLDAGAAIGDLHFIIDQQMTLAPDRSESIFVPVDPGLKTLSVLLASERSVAGLQLHALDSTGAKKKSFDLNCHGDEPGDALCSVQLQVGADLPAGMWQLSLAHSSEDLQALDVHVIGHAGTYGTYASRAAFLADADGRSGVLTASLVRDLPMHGLRVTAQIEGPAGRSQPLTLNDCGEGADAVAGDGLYTVRVPVRDAGVHRARVHFAGVPTSVHDPSIDARSLCALSSPAGAAAATSTSDGRVERVAHASLLIDGLDPARRGGPILAEDYGQRSSTRVDRSDTANQSYETGAADQRWTAQPDRRIRFGAGTPAEQGR